MITYDRDKVLDAYLNGVKIVDGNNHTREEVIDDDTSLVVMQGKDRPLCLFIRGSRGCCLNGLGYNSDKGYLYLSPWSEGGVVMGSDLTEENVADYNESVTFDSIKIVEWIDRDGTTHSTEEDA